VGASNQMLMVNSGCSINNNIMMDRYGDEYRLRPFYPRKRRRSIFNFDTTSVR